MLFFLFLILNGDLGKDIYWKKQVNFSIKKSKDTWSLTSQTQIARSATQRVSLDLYIADPFYARVTNLKGKNGKKAVLWRATTPEFEDVFYSDLVVHRASPTPTLEPGQPLTYKYRQKYRSPVFLPLIPVPNQKAMGGLEIVFNHPPDMEIDFQFFFPRDDVPYSLEKPTAKLTRLRFEALPYRSAGWPFEDVHAWVLPRLLYQKKALDQSDPEDFSNWYRQHLSNTSLPEEKELIFFDHMVAGLDSDRDKLTALHDFTRKEIRYLAQAVDIGSIIPRSPAQVLQKRYGDCKDRALLIRELAKRYGIEVQLALVSTEPEPSFGDFVKVGLFNHMICAWRDGDQWVYFDPTQGYLPFGMLSESLVGKPIFLISETAGHWQKTPVPEFHPELEIEVSANLSGDRPATATVRMRGEMAALANQRRLQSSKLDYENFVSNQVNSLFRKLSFDYFQVQEDRCNEVDCTYTAKVDLEDFLMISKRAAYVPGTPFSIMDRSLLDRENDNYPVHLNRRSHLLLRLNLKHPDFSPPTRKIHLEGAGGVFTGSFHTAEKTTTLEFLFRQSVKNFAGTSKSAYLEFCRQYMGHKNEMFIFRRRQEDP